MREIRKRAIIGRWPVANSELALVAAILDQQILGKPETPAFGLSLMLPGTKTGTGLFLRTGARAFIYMNSWSIPSGCRATFSSHPWLKILGMPDLQSTNPSLNINKTSEL